MVSVPTDLVSTYGPTITVPADSGTTVGELKALVASALGVSPSDLSLSSGGTPLNSDGTTLGASGIPNGGSIDAVHSGTVPTSPYTVSVALPADMHAVYGPTLTLPASG